LLGDIRKLVLETGLEVEMDEHLGYAKHDAVRLLVLPQPATHG
jgi:transposase-like protein